MVYEKAFHHQIMHHYRWCLNVCRVNALTIVVIIQYAQLAECLSLVDHSKIRHQTGKWKVTYVLKRTWPWEPNDTHHLTHSMINLTIVRNKLEVQTTMYLGHNTIGEGVATFISTLVSRDQTITTRNLYSLLVWWLVSRLYAVRKDVWQFASLCQTNTGAFSILWHFQ